MTASRLTVGVSAALFSALLSIDPSVRAGDAVASPPAIAALLPAPAAAEAGATPVDAPAPADVTLTITPESGRAPLR